MIQGLASGNTWFMGLRERRWYKEKIRRNKNLCRAMTSKKQRKRTQ